MAKRDPISRAGSLPSIILLAIVGAVGLSFWIRCGGEPRPTEGLAPDPGSAVAAPAAPHEPELAPQPARPDRREVAEVEEVAEERPTTIEREPRDLVVRVVTPTGELRDGVPVCFFAVAPDGESTALIQTMRISGAGDDGRELPAVAKRDPALRGLAVWRADRDLLRDYWQGFDRSQAIPEFGVGVSLPGAEASRAALDFASWPTEPIELVLDEAPLAMTDPLRVEVYFADGKPAPGVAVTLFGIPVDPNLGNIGEMGEAISGPDGVAYIERAQQNRFYIIFGQMGRAGMKMDDLMAFFVAPTFPMPLAPRTPVVGEPGEVRVVRVDLPPVGRLRGEIVDERGEPIDPSGPGGTGIHYRINWTAAPQPPKNRESRETLGGKALEASFDLGWVGLDMPLDARFWTADGNRPGESFEAVGPTAAGETKTLRFTLGKPFVRLAFQVLDVAGQQVADADLEYVVRESFIDPNPERGQQRFWRRIPTDAEGRIYWTFPDTATPGPRVLELRHTVQEPALWGSVTLPLSAPDPPAEGLEANSQPTIEMGTIQLGEAPLPELCQPLEQLLCGGIVTDLSGVPIRDASVWTRVAGENTNLANMKTGKDGRFELLVHEPVPFSISVYHEDYISQSYNSLEPGSGGLVYELAPGAALRGRLANAPLTLGGTLHVFVECEGVRRKDNARLETLDREDAAFEVRSLPAGLATVWIVGEEFDYEFARFENVELRAGEVLTDPRFDPLDLAPLARTQWFRFERTDGQPFEERYINLEIDGTRDSIGVRGRERKQLVIPAKAKRASFFASGYLPVEVELSGEEVLVRFEPAR